MFEPGSFKWAPSGIYRGSSIINEIIQKELKACFNPDYSRGLLIFLCCYFAIGPLGQVVYQDWRARKDLEVSRQENIQKNDAVQREMASVRAESLKFSASHERAIKIMGSNFVSIAEVIKHFGINPSDAELGILAEIPFSEVSLNQCKDTHILVPMFPLSINEIRARVPAEIFCDQSWYTDQAFANEEKCDTGWLLIRKAAVPNSTSKSYDEQVALLGNYEEVPRTCEVVYAATIYRLVRGDKLFSDVWVRTHSLSSNDGRVFVDFYDGRLDIYYWRDDGRSGHLGLASSRKVPR